MTVILAYSYLLIPTLAADFSLIETSLLSTEGYSLKRQTFHPGDDLEGWIVTAGKISEKSRVVINVVHFLKSSAREDFIFNGFGVQTTLTKDLEHTGFTGLPGGPECFRYEDPVSGSARFGIMWRDIEIDAGVSFSGIGKRGDFVWSGSNYPAKWEMLEGIVRASMANYLSSLHRPASDQFVEGARLKAYKDDRGTIFVPIDEWARARGCSLTYNRKPDRHSSSSQEGRISLRFRQTRSKMGLTGLRWAASSSSAAANGMGP